MATITDRYSSEESFMDFLESIGFSPAQRNRISLEGFTSMKILVAHSYQLEGSSGLEKYLRDLNKTYAGAAQAIRVHYTPRIVSCLAGCLNYYILSVYALHTIPGVLVIDANMAANHGKFWTKYKCDKNASDLYKDDDVATDLSKLKGATAWVAFRDAFTYKLRNAINARGLPMVCLIDTAIRAVTHENANLLEAIHINLNKELLFDTPMPYARIMN